PALTHGGCDLQRDVGIRAEQPLQPFGIENQSPAACVFHPRRKCACTGKEPGGGITGRIRNVNAREHKTSMNALFASGQLRCSSPCHSGSSTIPREPFPFGALRRPPI